MRTRACLFLLLALPLAGQTAPAAPAASSASAANPASSQAALDAAFAHVLAPEIDTTRVATIETAHFSVDALNFQLRSGLLALTHPVNGNIIAAVFRGEGELDVAPPTPGEAYQMNRFLGEPKIAVTFTEALFRFPDAGPMLASLGTSVKFVSNPNGGLDNVVLERAKIEDDDGWPDAARVLQGVYAPDPGGIGPFIADLKTEKYGWIQAIFDPQRRWRFIATRKMPPRAQATLTTFGRSSRPPPTGR